MENTSFLYFIKNGNDYVNYNIFFSICGCELLKKNFQVFSIFANKLYKQMENITYNQIFFKNKVQNYSWRTSPVKNYSWRWIMMLLAFIMLHAMSHNIYKILYIYFS